MNTWNLLTKYTIRRCCRKCRKWVVEEKAQPWPRSALFNTWTDALDYVVRSQTVQYHWMVGTP